MNRTELFIWNECSVCEREEAEVGYEEEGEIKQLIRGGCG
jgi:hypothetical protein